MRSVVFRVLAGFVAVGIGWLLLVADGGQRPALEVFRSGPSGPSSACSRSSGRPPPSD